MGYFKKLFRPFTQKKDVHPDNSRLLAVIEQYFADNKYESYKQVVFELEEGNSYLLIPSESKMGEEFSSWVTPNLGLKIQIGIWFADGLKATVAFTSEKTLYKWAKKPTKYVAFRSQMLLKLCEDNGIAGS